jgi:aryl-alcohol dehydrogenase-like predicted oxidoreductase
MFSQDIEGEGAGLLLATCRELGAAVVAYSPLGRGMLTRRYWTAGDFGERDGRRPFLRFRAENFGRNLELVEALKGCAERKGCLVGQLSLAWLLAQGEDVFPIP